MPCFHPVPAWVDAQSGAWVYSWSPKRELLPQVDTPCGKCEGCRRQRAADVSLRCMHEAHFHDAKCFLTLTFDDEHFPASQEAMEREVVLFVKRMRKASGFEVRTFAVCELGERTRRPHAHLLVFGRDFERGQPMARGEAGAVAYASAELSALWSHGHSSVGELTTASANYVARYVLKARSGAFEFEAVAHPLSGELIQFRPAVALCRSRGLGRRWFEAYGKQALHEGFVVLRGGVKVPIPQWYRRLGVKYLRGVGSDAEATAFERMTATAWNRTPERLAVREEVAAAGVAFHRKKGAL